MGTDIDVPSTIVSSGNPAVLFDITLSDIQRNNTIKAVLDQLDLAEGMFVLEFVMMLLYLPTGNKANPLVHKVTNTWWHQLLTKLGPETSETIAFKQEQFMISSARGARALPPDEPISFTVTPKNVHKLAGVFEKAKKFKIPVYCLFYGCLYFFGFLGN
jgi:hypothetical protein